MKQSILFIISFILCQSIHAQTDSSKQQFACSFKCNNSFAFIQDHCKLTFNTENRPIQLVNPYAEFDTIVAVIRKDLTNPFPLSYIFKPCYSICNAASIIVDSFQYIFYNPEFLNGIATTDTRKKWAIRCIIAHEIGHHILGHSVPSVSPGSTARRKRELEADYFNGYIIRQMSGATLDDALEGLRSLDPATYKPANEAAENGSDYPTLENRIISVTEGFNNNPGDSARIDMFRNITDVALRDYNRFGKSKIMRQLDRDIFYNDLAAAKALMDEYIKNTNDQELKDLLYKAKDYLNIDKKGTDYKIPESTEKPQTIDQKELERLRALYQQLINGNIDDRLRAEKILKQIRELEGRVVQ